MGWRQDRKLVVRNNLNVVSVLSPLGGMMTESFIRLLVFLQDIVSSKPTGWDGDTKYSLVFPYINRCSKPTAWDGDSSLKSFKTRLGCAF